MSNPPPPTKRAKTQKASDDFPDDIKLSILHKLPIKSIIRFTCISKNSLSLIKNPTFITTHLNLSISSSPNKTPLLLLHHCSLDHDGEYFSLRFDNQTFDNYINLPFPFKIPKPCIDFCFKVIGTINGLICFGLYDMGSPIIIWNPIIRKYVSLPKPILTSYKNYRVSFGFGFDPRSNDYKVIKLVMVSTNVDDYIAAEFYSLNSNSWTIIPVNPAYEVNWSANWRGRQGFVFVNGVVHCLARRVGDDGKYRNFIMGFDVGGEVFKEIMLPSSLVKVVLPHLSISVCNQSMTIAVFEQYEIYQSLPKTYVWVMEQYGKVESWTKIFNVTGFGDLLGITKNRGLFHTSSYNDEICCRHMPGGPNQSFGVRGVFPFVGYFVESMELLNNPNAESDANN